MLEEIRRNRTPVMYKILKEAGYSDNYAKTCLPTKSKGWAQLLAKLDDEKLLDELYDVAMSKIDKRAKLQAIDMILRLKDRYPAAKRINANLNYKELIEDLTDDK